MMVESGESGVAIRAVAESDTPTLLRMIHALAAYEQRADTCTVSQQALHEALFGARPRIEAIIAEQGGEAVGFALYFGYFSPSIGVPATFLELLYVIPEQRGRGTGRALLQRVSQIAVEQGADRLEWGVMKRNEPAIGFYARLGATVVDDFFACRLDGDALRSLAHRTTGA
jgi:GNAT superfamily N-acetyltransferase